MAPCMRPLDVYYQAQRSMSFAAQQMAVAGRRKTAAQRMAAVRRAHKHLGDAAALMAQWVHLVTLHPPEEETEDAS